MDYKDFQIFCDLCKTLNISATAERLFITQSAVTHRLQKLEEHLHVTLFERGQGKIGMSLTMYGERFAQLAEQWMHLYAQAENLADEPLNIQLVFGGIDSVACYLLPEFFRDFLTRNSHLSLNLYTYNSWDIYTHLESGEIDVGVTHLNPILSKAGGRFGSNIAVEPLFSEPYVLISSSATQNFPPSGVPVNLDTMYSEHEVYAEFDIALRNWQLRTYPDRLPRMYALGSVALVIPQLMSDSMAWSIVPFSAAKRLCQSYPLAWHPINCDIPERPCCVCYNQKVDCQRLEAICLFIKDLRHYLEDETLYRF